MTAVTERRRQSRARAIFAGPSSVLDEYLLSEERKVYDEPPSVWAMIENSLFRVLAGLAGLGFVAYLLAKDLKAWAGLTCIVVSLMLGDLVVKRWKETYTRHVLTDMRIIRIQGFLRRDMAFIPWGKVTDVRFQSRPIGRLLGFTTVFIDSANEDSGLKSMTNLKDVEKFKFWLVQGVRMKQGGLPHAEIDRLERLYPEYAVAVLVALPEPVAPAPAPTASAPPAPAAVAPAPVLVGASTTQSGGPTAAGYQQDQDVEDD